METTAETIDKIANLLNELKRLEEEKKEILFKITDRENEVKNTLIKNGWLSLLEVNWSEVNELANSRED